MAKSFNLTTHARHDAAHCLAPNLFVTLKRGDRKKLKLDVSYEFNANESLRFIGFEPLDASDMKLLQALVALAGPSEIILDLDEPKSDSAKNLVKLMDPKQSALLEDSRIVNVTMTKLLNECGLTDGGSNREKAIESLLRLSNVTVVATIKKKQWSCHLLSYGLDQGSNKIVVALNPRITDAVLGKRQHTTINMEEVRAIKTDTAAILHQRLCAVIDEGKSKALKEETLISYIWSNTEHSESHTVRQNRFKLKKAIKDIENTNKWKFEELGAGTYKVNRYKIALKLTEKPS